MTTTSYSPAGRPSALRRLSDDALELLGSMRFAVSLLMFVCVASILGTVLPQDSASSAYIDQFGPFWFEVLDKFSIWHVYNSWWFLLIMAFLVASTTMCLVRNTPKMLHDARSFREHVRESSLRAFPHRVEFSAGQPVSEAASQILAMLGQMGFAVREKRAGESILLAAKKGSANRLGYIFAHVSMVIICVGGLLDSQLPVRMQVWLGGKHPIVQNMLIADVPASGRLAVGNPSYRSSVLVPEGGEVNSSVVMVDDGALVQPLPFTLKLKKFIIDYYPTGMPSRFASEVEATDRETGKSVSKTIEVNEPLRYKGVTVYQSSFDDGGSKVTLTGYPLAGQAGGIFRVDGTVGKTAAVDPGAPADERDLKVDITGLRPINVEDFSGGEPKAARSLQENVASVAGSAAGKKNDKLHNVGPSVSYRLTDKSGQSHEFQNYMLPVQLDGQSVFLAGVRPNDGEPFRYLRIPADQDNTVAEFMRLRAVLADPAARQEAARRFAQASAPSANDRQALQTAAERALQTFATGGLQSVASFLQANTPPAEQERAANIVIRLIGSTMLELRNIERERAKLPPVATEGAQAEAAAAWSRSAVAALSDLTVYPAPVFFSLTNFQQIQASVFQVSRTPGKKAVYLGSLLLILGVFSMFYIRDRRIWVWLKPDPSGDGTLVQAAMTAEKRTLDFNREFERFKQALLRLRKS